MIYSTELIYNLEFGIVLLWSLVIYFTMVVWHELGHMLWYKIHKKRDVKLYIDKFNLEIGTKDDYDCLSNKEYKDMLILGLLFGFIPLMITLMFNTPIILIILIIPYIIGSKSDIKNIINF